MRQELLERYAQVRARTLALAEPLEPEDQVIQTMPDVSPTKWHLGHTSWFFESFLLAQRRPGWSEGLRDYDPRFKEIFNSYYNGIGEQWDRPRRGILSRPPLAVVHGYRRAIDQAVRALIEEVPQGELGEVASTVVLGLHHEEQHQELLVTDIKHVLASNPLQPAYHQRRPAPAPASAPPREFLNVSGGMVSIGAPPPNGGPADFCYDCETPVHKVWLEDFAIAAAPVTCGDFQAFVEDGGYRTPALWLADGWDTVQRRAWEAPLYWERDGEGGFIELSLFGPKAIDANAPMAHLSFYEADAFARWAGARMPTEFEWEHLARSQGASTPRGTCMDDGDLHPVGRACAQSTGLRYLYGEVWEWTASAFLPYRGFQPLPGPASEYNGKFMSGQMVLRGASCATPLGHSRPSYRNFFHPDKRWQFTGLRLARDAGGSLEQH